MTARRINLNLNKMNYIYIHITLAEMGEERATGTEYQFQNIWQCNAVIANIFFDILPFAFFKLWNSFMKKTEVVSRKFVYEVK